MRRLALTAALFILGYAGGIQAETVQRPHIEAELVAESLTIKPGMPFYAGLRLKMEKHWHTYWINPGDSGLATSLTWKLPPGFTAGDIEWPAPGRINLPPLTSYGYEGEILLPVKITPPANLKAGSTITLNADADWLVCEETCIPGKASLSLTLSIQATSPVSDPARAALFARAKDRLPVPAPQGAVTLSAAPKDLEVRVISWQGAVPSEIQFYPMEGGFIAHAAQQSAAVAPNSDLVLIVKRDESQPEAPARLGGVLVFTRDGKTTIWQVDEPLKKIGAPTIIPSTPVPASKNSLSHVNLLGAAVFAFLGGLILNLMPCVLPVLGLKILGFVHQAGGDRKKAWHHGLIFTAGVLVSFWSLAGLLIALRAGGEQLGWGFQLQDPRFVALLALFFFLFGLNLLGVFEVGTSLIGWGQGASSHGWTGSFFSGVLATIVATPCTAPFMGSALGVALSQPPAGAFLIFTALALGMAFPYLLLSANPGWLRFVPKPGAWMETLKQLFGFGLLATVVWLLWVFGKQAGVDGLTGLLVALLLAAIAGWGYGKWTALDRTPRVRGFASLLTALLLISAVAVSWRYARFAPPENQPVAEKDGWAWEPYSPEKLASLRAAGTPVFIDFTAAWCLSCQVNERVAFGSTEVRNKFWELGVVPMKADWTRRDPQITTALASLGRSGVPVYVLYGRDPAAPPVLLPEVLTAQIVLDALAALKP